MEPILIRDDISGVVVLTLNRPTQRNALNLELMGALIEAFGEISADKRARVAVIRANGPVFCAGHDLKEMRRDPSEAAQQRTFETCTKLMLSIVNLPQPVIAQVHGIATAAGCQLVAGCDLAVASQDARFATPGVNIGLFCSTPMVALSRAVGRKRAMEMLLTGDMVDAREAQSIGLINRAVPADKLEETVMQLAEKISAKSSAVVRIGKEAFYRQSEMSLAGAYEYAGAVMVRNMMEDDAAEGIDAFLEKRKPVWKG